MIGLVGVSGGVELEANASSERLLVDLFSFKSGLCLGKLGVLVTVSWFFWTVLSLIGDMGGVVDLGDCTVSNENV